MIKTKDSLFNRLKEVIRNNHPYEVPEIIGMKIDQVDKDYCDWVIKEASAQPFST